MFRPSGQMTEDVGTKQPPLIIQPIFSSSRLRSQTSSRSARVLIKQDGTAEYYGMYSKSLEYFKRRSCNEVYIFLQYGYDACTILCSSCASFALGRKRRSARLKQQVSSKYSIILLFPNLKSEAI